MLKNKHKNTEKENLKWLSIPSNLIFNDSELRLNANSYSFEYLQAVSIIEKLKRKGAFVDKLGNLADDIFYPSRFKRRYVKNGIPFLSSIEIFRFDMKANKYIQNPPANSLVSENWILITRSGSIGRTIISNKLFKSFSVSEHAIRYIPKKDEKLGYIYAYLNTSIGQSLLNKSKFGAVIDQIEPHHIANLPIPRLPEIEKEINNLILKAHKLREEAQRKLLEAEKLFYEELKLPKIDEDSIEYYRGEKGKEIKAFTIKASELNDRLDASFHIPLAHTVIKILQAKSLNLLQLNSIANIFHLPTYKRIYVDKSKGYPILSGSHLSQIKYIDVKYISPLSFVKGSKNFIDKYKVKEGWILTTERGTTGINMLVSKSIDGWLASHNLLRVIPHSINPGYLITFLNSEYGQFQLQSKNLGAVVNVLDPKDMGDIYIPIPDEEIQNKIGSLVIDAYNKKDQANILEQQAIEKLENILKNL